MELQLVLPQKRSPESEGQQRQAYRRTCLIFGAGVDKVDDPVGNVTVSFSLMPQVETES